MGSDQQPAIGLSKGPVTRRKFLGVALGAAGVMAASACGGATQPAKPTEPPQSAEAKPTAASKPAAETKPAEAKPAAGAPATQAAPAAKASTPNFAGAELNVLQWISFIPDSDQFYQKQIDEDFTKTYGARARVEVVNGNDLQPKIAASIQAGTGPDIVQFQYNWQHIYKESIVDLSDVAEDVKQQTGDFFPALDAACKVDGKYLGIPHDVVPNAVHWRKSWFKDAGAEQFPATFDELFAVGKKLKQNGRPLGQALGHSFGDPATWSYPMLWSYGGREVDESGKVAINSPETVAAVRAMKESWTDAFDDTGLAWDDTANNRAFLAETISATNNGVSIWFVARKDQAPFADDIGLDLLPAGPRGRSLFLLHNNYAVMKYSKNVEAAKAFVRWSMQDSVWLPWFEFCQSYYTAVGPKHNASPAWSTFSPDVQKLKDAAALGRAPGWPGPYNQQAGLAQAKYIVVDMFARAVQGDSPEAAVAWAENELKQVYV